MDIASLAGILLGVVMVIFGIFSSGGITAFGNFVDIPSVFMEKIEQKYGDTIPTLRGDISDQWADFATIAITDLCKMSNGRIDRMLNSLVSELPAFLNKNEA